MTEFHLQEGCVLGLMPEGGIKRLLGATISDPATAHGIPRAEVYLHVEDAEAAFERALRAGARLLSPMQKRDWGDTAGYCQDADGHVLGFAR